MEQAAELRREVEVIHCPGDIKVRIRVETVDKRHALVAKIAFDLKVGIETIAHAVAVLQVAPEFPVQGGFREISDVRGHPRHREATLGQDALIDVVAAAPVRIGHDRLAADFMEGDILRRVSCGPGNRRRRKDPVSIPHAPFEDLHGAHASAGHAEKLFDAEMVDQTALRRHHVADGDNGKLQPPGFSGLGVDFLWSGGAHAAAEYV